MDVPRGPDHGTFRVGSSFNDDLKILRNSIAAAKQNQAKPGHHWLRVVVKQTLPDRVIEVIKLYHVDLNANLAEITETVGGAETARRTLSLDEAG